MSEIPIRTNHNNDKQVIDKIKNLLKITSQKLMKIETQEEILSYVADTFTNKLMSDFIAIALIDEGNLELKYDNGGLPLNILFPYPVAQSNPKLFEQSILGSEPIITEDSPLRIFMDAYDVESWFTVPIIDENEILGLCIVGYDKDEVMYYQIGDNLEEFGNYLAIALKLIQKNQSRNQKLTGMELISQNLTVGESIVDLINKTVNFSAQGTDSRYVAIYVLNEQKNAFVYEPPGFGILEEDYSINIDSDEELSYYWPNLEKTGNNKISVPLILNQDLIGILHAGKVKNEEYTMHDLDILNMYANYFTAMYDNIKLRNKEKKQKQILESLLQTEQAFVQETLSEDNFDGINLMLAEMLKQSVILYNRFFNPISHYIMKDQNIDEDSMVKAGQIAKKSVKFTNKSFSLKISDTEFYVIPIKGGGQLHGFLCISNVSDEMDNVFQLAIKLIRNIYALQFIKQKIELDTREQVKNTFMQRLMVPVIEDLNSLLDYAASFDLDLYKPHRVVVIGFKFESHDNYSSIVNEKTVVTSLLEQIRQIITDFDSTLVTSILNHELTVLAEIRPNSPQQYWQRLYTKIEENLDIEDQPLKVIIGIGGISKEPDQYYDNYQKAQQTFNVLSKGITTASYEFFDQLGSYIVLNQVKDTDEANIFINDQLRELFVASNNQTIDLFNTLRIYLKNNGSIKDTSEELYLHRSTLSYRLDKIKDILKVDLDNATTQFELILAYRLLDLSNENIFENP